MKYRKRKLIIEKKQEKNSVLDRFIPVRDSLRENRFFVELYGDNGNITINPENITGLDFFDDKIKGSFIVISCVVFVNDNIWVNHFKNINICQISFLNYIGEVVNFLDYDVFYEESNYKVSYKSDNPLTFEIKYKIF